MIKLHGVQSADSKQNQVLERITPTLLSSDELNYADILKGIETDGLKV